MHAYTTHTHTHIPSYLLDAANDYLGQWVDQRLHDITGVDRAEEPTPEIQTMDVLPVVNGLVVFLQGKGWRKKSNL